MDLKEIESLRKSREAKRKQTSTQAKQLADELEKLQQEIDHGLENKNEECKAKVAKLLVEDRKKAQEPPPPLLRETSLPSYEALYFGSGEMSPSTSFGSSLNIHVSAMKRSTSSSSEDDSERKSEKKILQAEKKAEEKIQALRLKEKERAALLESLLAEEKRRAEALKVKRDQALNRMLERHQAEGAALAEAEKRQMNEREKRRQRWQKEEDESEARWKEASNAQKQAAREALLSQAKREEEEELERRHRQEKEDDLMEKELNKEAARLLKEAALLAKAEPVHPPEAEPTSGSRPEPRLEGFHTLPHDPKTRSSFVEVPDMPVSPDPHIISTTGNPNRDSVVRRPSRSLSLTNSRAPDPEELGLPPKAAPTATSTTNSPASAPASKATPSVNPTTNTNPNPNPSSNAIPYTPAATAPQSRSAYAASRISSASEKSKQSQSDLLSPPSMASMVSQATATTPTAAATSSTKQSNPPSRAGSRGQLFSPGATLASAKASPKETQSTTPTTPPAAAAEPTTRTARRLLREAQAAEANNPSSQTSPAPSKTAAVGPSPSTPSSLSSPPTGRRKSFSDHPRGKEPPPPLEDTAAPEAHVVTQTAKEKSLALQKYEEDPELYQARIKMLQEDIGVAKPGKIDPNLWTAVANEGSMDTSHHHQKLEMPSSKSKSSENLPASTEAKRKSYAVTVNSDVCTICQKTAYPMEKIEADKRIFHKTCFRCSHCKIILQLGNYASINGEFYCKAHFLQLFALKGNYDEGFGRMQHRGRRSSSILND